MCGSFSELMVLYSVVTTNIRIHFVHWHIGSEILQLFFTMRYYRIQTIATLPLGGSNVGMYEFPKINIMNTIVLFLFHCIDSFWFWRFAFAHSKCEHSIIIFDSFKLSNYLKSLATVRHSIHWNSNIELWPTLTAVNSDWK